MEFDEFRNNVRRLNDVRNHKIKNSYGVYDAFKWERKNGWKNIGRSVKEKEYYKIIRKVNDYLADILIDTGKLVLPNRMGTIEARKYQPILNIKDGKVITTRPIDWDKTLKMWYEYPETFKNKQLVRQESEFVFKFVYDKSQAKYKNKGYYSFNVNRSIKRIVSNKIKLGNFDAFLL